MELVERKSETEAVHCERLYEAHFVSVSRVRNGSERSDHCIYVVSVGGLAVPVSGWLPVFGCTPSSYRARPIDLWF